MSVLFYLCPLIFFKCLKHLLSLLMANDAIIKKQYEMISLKLVWTQKWKCSVRLRSHFIVFYSLLQHTLSIVRLLQTHLSVILTKIHAYSCILTHHFNKKFMNTVISHVNVSSGIPVSLVFRGSGWYFTFKKI